MEFYLGVYGTIVLIMSLLYYYDDRHNEGAGFRFTYALSVGLFLVFGVYSINGAISNMNPYASLSSSTSLIRTIILYFIMFTNLLLTYVFVIVIFYGFMKQIYKETLNKE